MKLAIIIPAFNEAKRIGAVLESLSKFKYQVFVIDDGSSDKTLETAQKYNCKVLHHKVNLGKGAALKTGCEAAFEAGFEGVIMMDSDGQHSLDDLPKLAEKLSEGQVDIVFGSRNMSFGTPLVRFLGNKTESVLISVLFGIYVSDLICGYRAFTKSAYKKIIWESRGYDVEAEMVIRTGIAKLKYCEVPIQTIYYDKFKGMTISDGLFTLLNIIKWRITK